MVTPTPPGASASNGRLNGWKEIAVHLGRGVRTVQRWEKELGLPVRRLGTGRGEVVFALVSDIEAWRRTVETPPGDLDAPVGEEEAPIAPRPRKGTRLAVVVPVALLLLAAGAALLWWSLARRSAIPSDARVENRALRVYDASGRLLWEYRFEFPLADSPAIQRDRRAAPSTLIGDIDADGSPEVLFFTNHELPNAGHALYCFDHRGRLRFRHAVHPRVSFGSIPCTGPWRPHAALLLPEGDRHQAIWVAFNDRDQFPTVVQKIDARGDVLGEFWTAGHVTALMATTFRGRPVVLVGGASNEFNGAAVSVVDRDRPTGTAPALRPKFVCHGCPTGDPVAFVAFPGTEIERLQDNNAAIMEMSRGDHGEFSVRVRHVLCFRLLEGARSADDLLQGTTDYTFAPDLRPLSAEHQPDYRVLHNEAFRRGFLNHPFGPADDAALWPVLGWDGTKFEGLRPSPPTD